MKKLPLPTSMLAVTFCQLPCFIIHGKHDETIPYHHAEDLHNDSKSSTLLTLDESKHNYVNDNDSTIIEMALNEFFKKLTSKHALD